VCPWAIEDEGRLSVYDKGCGCHWPCTYREEARGSNPVGVGVQVEVVVTSVETGVTWTSLEVVGALGN